MKRTARSNRVFVGCLMIVSLVNFTACEKTAHVDAGVTARSATGSIIGSVRTSATPPSPVSLPDSVHKVCGAEISDSTLQLGPEQSLANVVVWVEDAPQTEVPAGAKPPFIDQQKCAYVPPVAVGHTGGKLKVKNSDPLMHNVRAGELFNVGMPIEGQVIERSLPATEGAVKIVCDVHPWMRADVMVLSHEQWAITDANGRFELKGVAAGARPLHFWHATRGEKKVTVDVPAGGEGKVTTEL